MTGEDLGYQIVSMCREFAWEKRKENQQAVLAEVFGALMATVILLLEQLPPAQCAVCKDVIISGLRNSDGARMPL